MPDDTRFMLRALELAKQGRGKVSPNPMVGCVIVKQGRIIAEGWHERYGGDHAETSALKKAGAGAKGAVMYVTLEPCAHWGKTPPCSDAVLAAGIRKVVIAMVDPNPLTRGKSVRRLRRAGVTVEVGVCGDDALALNRSFTKYISGGTPFTVAKTAQTLDGRIATRRGESKWITSGEARAYARARRDEFDAIMVGIGTVLADDPTLDAPGKRIRKIVLDSRLRLPEDAGLLKGALPGQVLVAVTRNAASAKARRLEKRGVCVMLCPEKDGRVDLGRLFSRLAGERITSVLLEGGAELIGSALKAGLVDELNVYIAPLILGDIKARSSVVGLNILDVAKAKAFHLTSMEQLGRDILLKLKV